MGQSPLLGIGGFNNFFYFTNVMELSEIKQAIGLKPYFQTDLGVLYNFDCLKEED